MALRLKIDSNETGLSYAEEASLGVLPVTPRWIPLEPNSYEDFGGELTLLARNPINSSRQRKKGVITDLDASGGFNQDFTQTNTTDILQGFMFADLRTKIGSAVDEVSATQYELPDTTGFAADMLVFASGFENTPNNGVKLVTAVDVTGLNVAGLAVEASPPADAKITLVGRRRASGDVSISVTGGFPSLTSTGGGLDTIGLIVGEWVYLGSDTASARFANNVGYARISSIASGAIRFDRTTWTPVTEAGTGKTIELYFGTVLKNELGALIKRRSYQLERQLGAPDTSNPNDFQAEYLVGAIANELTVNVEQADKINIDLSFIAINNDQRTAGEGLKTGTRVVLDESDAFNTSTDFVDMRLFVNSTTTSNPTALFAYLMDYTVSINNNASPNKAVSVLGAFDVTAGTFEVSGEATAYFTTVEAIQAVRRNADVSFFTVIAKDNYGWILDMPLIALGDARLDVEQDEPITLPLTMDAATAVKLNKQMDYTLLWVFFSYLPDAAMPKL